MAELCRSWTPDAVKALVVALRYPPTRVPAAIALLDRGWGKPEVRIHTESESTVLHLIAAQAISAELVNQAAPAIEHQAEARSDQDPPTE